MCSMCLCMLEDIEISASNHKLFLLLKQMQSRRVTRCRTDDAGAANSVNPSPKKQPRLNLPASKSENQWNSNNRTQMDDGSLRKRSKVEERDYNVDDRTSLSDIQFIDSITPEHTVTANTIYACAQVHNPPASNRTSLIETPTESRPQLRITSFDNKMNDKIENKECRFSYPGMGQKFSDDKSFLSRFSINENSDKNRRSFNELKSLNRGVQSSDGLVLSNSLPEHLKNNENDQSKCSLPTPSSPSKSPRYSLLVGETSSENSSTLNTPAFDMDMSSATHHFDQRLNELKGITAKANSDAKDTTMLMFTDESQQNVMIELNLIFYHVDLTNSFFCISLSSFQEAMDMRRDLTLDLEKSKMSVDDISPPSNKQNMKSSTSNTPNITEISGSTSQSITPSEFAYQNLNRPSNAVSADESTPKTDVFETLEQAFSSYEQATTPVQTLPPIKVKSPIKATINITYKSPNRTKSPQPHEFPDYEPVEVISMVTKPLETSFDDNNYEKLKFFKGAVSEVNDLLDNDAESPANQNANSNTPSQVVPSNAHNNKADCGDVLMSDQELTLDSLEFDSNVSLYENVNLRKIPNSYENMKFRTTMEKPKSISICETTTTPLLSLGKENSRPKNFTVKQLANKFETSPIDTQPPFDFSKPFARPASQRPNGPSNCDTTNRNSAKVLTRSLDENAFIREFGKSNEKVNRSTHQIPVVTNILTENSPIRRSFNDATKVLNPPKRLPHLNDADNNKSCKKENVDDTAITPTTENPISLIQHNVGLDAGQGQTQGQVKQLANNEKKVLSNFKLDRERIERIKEERRHQLNEKFRSESFKCEKENNKVKSKSKIELNELKDADKRISDSLQYKSKSRNEIYNKKEAELVLDAPNDGPTGQRVRSISDEKNQNGNNDNEQSVAFRTRKFDRKSIDLKREQELSAPLNGTRTSVHLQ